MGNRAVLEIEGTGLGIYLHWNGGRDTIDPLLEVAKEYEIQDKGVDFLVSNLNQIVSNTFGKCGIGKLDTLDCDNYDNGVYVIDADLNIVDRKFTRYPEQKHWDFNEMKEFIKEQNDKFFKKS
tara:strand:- start:107 stop:475 length:369 start_codon:yes stop_codon:yes gene_type:complete